MPQAPGRRPPLFVVLAVVLTVLSLLALVTANVLLGQAGFEQVDLERRVAEQSAAIEELELDVARLRSPVRLARAAEDLGLVPATDLTLLMDDRSDGGPSPNRGRE
ncbi:MAG TPA: hypothetical protein VGB83_11890 [Actinomycetota bacterium]